MVGKGVAMRMRGLGAQVIVTEIDSVKALEAVMDGFRVMPMAQAAPQADLIVTVTGNVNVVDREHFESMKDGAMMANSGHFDSEVNLRALEEMSGEGRRTLRPMVEEFRISESKSLVVLGEGRLINLAAAEGHPASVMDMSFANQALSAEYLVKEGKNLKPDVYAVPRNIDHEIARLKLVAMNVEIDSLTKEQEKYLVSWLHN